MNVRLVPVGPSLRHFHRIVRDLAASQGKRAMLVLEGEDVEVDTTVIEQLKDPITHMIRNAIDHGIEDRRHAPLAARTPPARSASPRFTSRAASSSASPTTAPV